MDLTRVLAKFRDGHVKFAHFLPIDFANSSFGFCSTLCCASFAMCYAKSAVISATIVKDYIRRANLG